MPVAGFDFGVAPAPELHGVAVVVGDEGVPGGLVGDFG